MRVWSVGTWLFVASSACGGVANEHADPSAGGTAGSANAGAEQGGSIAGTAGFAGISAGTGAMSAIPSQARRLTANEYVATTSDVLGTSTPVRLAEFGRERDSFDNNAALNHVDQELFVRYLQTAETLAAEVFASDALRARVVTCSQADDAACVRQIVNDLGLHLFRRPLLADELAAYEQAYARARARELSHVDSLEEVLVALLTSVQFVYRIELAPSEAGTRAVSPYDLAARLSYLLWSSAPDAPLLDAAKEDALDSDEQLAAAVERLLQDPRSSRFARDFAGQWLGARRVRELPLQPTTSGEWTLGLAASAADEIEAYFGDLVQRDNDFRALFSSPAHFVNESFAPLYGLSVPGSASQRVELTGVDRRGLLGLAGFLVQRSNRDFTSPTGRGAWILDRLLCSPPPPPPPDSPGLPEPSSPIGPALERLIADPECGKCHSLTDPIGLALEQYDAIGRLRSAYPDGSPIDSSVTLSDEVFGGAPPGQPATGIAGLSTALAGTPQFTSCVARRLYSYGFGLSLDESGPENPQALAERWRSGPLTMKQLILSLVQSPPFRTRSDGGGL